MGKTPSAGAPRQLNDLCNPAIPLGPVALRHRITPALPMEVNDFIFSAAATLVRAVFAASHVMRKSYSSQYLFPTCRLLFPDSIGTDLRPAL
jgi:hypothetical protein